MSGQKWTFYAKILRTIAIMRVKCATLAVLLTLPSVAVRDLFCCPAGELSPADSGREAVMQIVRISLDLAGPRKARVRELAEHEVRDLFSGNEAYRCIG